MNPEWPQMLDELFNDDSDKMTPWEVGFVKSLDRQCDSSPDGGWCPSKKQMESLEEVWSNVFG